MCGYIEEQYVYRGELLDSDCHGLRPAFLWLGLILFCFSVSMCAQKITIKLNVLVNLIKLNIEST